MATQQQLSFFNLSLLDADALISPQINLYNAPICLTWGFLSSENQLQQGHICSIWALPLNLPQTRKNLATFKLISIPHPRSPSCRALFKWRRCFFSLSGRPAHFVGTQKGSSMVFWSSINCKCSATMSRLDGPDLAVSRTFRLRGWELIWQHALQNK